MNPGRPRGVPSQRQRWEDFVQLVSIGEALHQREKAELRAQVHDLTELLAAFDLCEIKDAHLNAVRDRAFRRDIAPDAELLEVYRVERQLRQEALLHDLEEELAQQTSAANDRGKASEVPGQLDGSLSVSKRDVASLQLRVEGLEQDVANLHLRHALLLETAPRLKHPAVKAEAGTDADCMLPCAANDVVEMDAQRRAEVERPTIQEQHEVTMKSTQDQQQQQQRVLELEKALAAELTKNAELKQQNRRYEEVEKILKEFSRSP